MHKVKINGNDSVVNVCEQISKIIFESNDDSFVCVEHEENTLGKISIFRVAIKEYGTVDARRLPCDSAPFLKAINSAEGDVILFVGENDRAKAVFLRGANVGGGSGGASDDDDEKVKELKYENKEEREEHSL